MIHDYSGLTVWRIETVKGACTALAKFMCFKLQNSLDVHWEWTPHAVEFISGKITNFGENVQLIVDIILIPEGILGSSLVEHRSQIIWHSTMVGDLAP